MYRYNVWTEEVLPFVVGAAVVFAFIGGLVGGVLYGVVQLERGQCSGFATISGREAKYVKDGPLSWHCYVRLDNGTWLPKEQLRDMAD